MGAWGTSLYSNDAACDLRGDYLNKLKLGRSNLEAYNELLQEYSDTTDDPEEGPLFWYALADTQWNYGRLLPEVKERALYYLHCNEEGERWLPSEPKKCEQWNRTLIELKDKLNTPQPAEKNVSHYRLYRCKWQLGSVFAYKLASDYSKAMGLDGKYVLFRKVSEDIWYPGHIVPVVQFYLWLGDNPPSMDEIKDLPVLPVKMPQYTNGISIEDLQRNVKLICQKEKDISQNHLFCLGNVSDSAIVPFQGKDYWTGYKAIGWEHSNYNHKFEHYFLDRYHAWKESGLLE